MTLSIRDNPQLPSHKIGTDRQRGYALLKWLREHRDVYQLIIELDDLRSQPVKLSTLLSGKGAQRPMMDDGYDISIFTALDLAARAEFTAAGALYLLWTKRIEEKCHPQIKKEWTLLRKQKAAQNARHEALKRAEERASLRLMKIGMVLRRNPGLSSSAIARIAKIPEVSVRRLRRKTRPL
jgi:hypothetical protein